MIHRDDADQDLRIVFERREIEFAPDWRASLPTLRGERVALRALRASDAPSLLDAMTSPEVSRFISAPPSTASAFERFIECSLAEGAAGKLACFAVTLQGEDTAIGLFQIRAVEADFKTAEWGFALASAFWGTGIFEECAELALEFAFTHMGVHRMEARVAAKNGRGNRALQKLGAAQEGVLREAFLCGGEYLDQVIYSVIEDDWRASRGVTQATRRVLVH